MPKIAKFFLALAFAMAAGHAAQAQTFDLVTGDIPPYSIKSGDRPGFIREFVAEMAKVLKVSVNASFHPMGEAIEKARTGENTLVFPLARTAQREPNFTWVVKLFDMEACFLTVPGKPAVAGPEDAKGRRIGALKGSAFTAYLADKGFTGVVEGANSAELAGKLVAGEIDVWFADLTEATATWRAAGHAGAPVKGHRAFTGALWLGASLKAPAIDVAAWEDAFQVLQQDGTFDRIYQSYGLK